MKKDLATTVNGYGEKVATAILYQENGQLYLWEINCWSANDLGLGTCLCNNHPMGTETPISTSEVIRQFGAEALDGFEAPSDRQLVFDTFGVEINELETFCRISYRLGFNPLPVLRSVTECKVVYSENPDLLAFPEAEPGTLVFIINSRGEISVREVDDNDPEGMPEMAIPY